MENIKGSIDHIIFHNEKNGYTVGEMDAGGELVTFVGNFDELREGEYLSLSGHWTEHPSFGEQFQVQSYALELPTSIEGVIRYLGSGLLPGIGEKTAREIVARFGDDTLEILDENPDRLGEVRGIGQKTLEKIKEVYSEQREIRRVMIQIQEYGISSALALKMYKTYGPDTVGILLTDPYKIVKDVRGIGFKTADQIAAQLGVEADSPQRITAGIAYTLRSCYNDGSTYLLEDELIRATGEILGVSYDEIASYIQELTITGDLHIDYVDEEKAYYPMALFQAEDDAALAMVRLAGSSYTLPEVDVAAMIDEYEATMDIALDARQREAVAAAVDNGVVVITGGPGTGKTTIINGIVGIFKALGIKTVLAAPTGRAAKRMSETTGEEAKTIHRLLEYDYSEDDDFPSFSRDVENPLEVDAVIVDEASMIDIVLMDSLLSALTSGTRLILVGDADQLPSVGPGNVLADIIQSDVTKVVRLDKIFRQSDKSMISLNAHEINQGLVPKIDNESDFIFVRKMDQEVILATILDLVAHRIPEKKGFDAQTQIQVIAPMKKGLLGVVNLNRELQALLNPPLKHKEEKSLGNLVFREGDKIMQIRNNYQLKWEDIYSREIGEGVYNGDIGHIEAIDNEEKTFTILFSDDKRAVYDFELLDDLTHAYAMTVHKSQGSEFPVVVMPMVSGPPMFLNRRLLYTAVTRAKQMLMLIGPQNYFYRMVRSDAVDRRRTALKERILMYESMK